MATITLYLGKGKKETVNLLVRIRDGRNIDIKWTSPMKLPPAYWDSAKQTIKNRLIINATEKALLTDKIKNIRELCEQAYEDLKNSADGINSTNFAEYIQRLLYPKRYEINDFFKSYSEFLEAKKNLSEKSLFQLQIIKDYLLKFQKYKQVFQNKSFVLSYNIWDDKLLQEFYDFLIEEYKYNNHPQIQSFYKEHGYQLHTKIKHLNTANDRLKKFRIFWLWSIKKGYVTKNPFQTFTIPADRLATPIFLLPEEVKKIYNLDLKSNETLSKARDLFVFQCMIGCRREDLWEFTRDNIQDGVLSYVARKTLKKSQRNIRIPLNSIATEILDKYKDKRKPLPTDFKITAYNRYIKKLCYLAELA